MRLYPRGAGEPHQREKDLIESGHRHHLEQDEPQEVGQQGIGGRRPAPGTVGAHQAAPAVAGGPWDALVLSNVLEHAEGRVPFLRGLVAQSGARLVLIRVPLYQRHWHVPLREELGLSYFSDPTHFIEHTLAEFLQETAESGLTTVEMNTRWGEIWAVCRPAAAVGGAPREPADSTGGTPVASGENAG